MFLYRKVIINFQIYIFYESNKSFDEFNLPKIPGLLEINCSPLEEFVKHYFLSEELKDLPLETKKKLAIYGCFDENTICEKNGDHITYKTNLTKEQKRNHFRNIYFIQSPDLEKNCILKQKILNT